MASLVEAEAKVPEDRPKIARVIYNRLAQGHVARHRRHGASTPSRSAQATLTQSELDTDSPYNTRSSRGLPPTPINSPGQASIDAALHPADGDWLYYVLCRQDGQPVLHRQLSPTSTEGGEGRPGPGRLLMAAPTGSTRLAAVIGAPVRHSLSPVLHNAAFAAVGLDWVYVALEVRRGSGAGRAGRDAGAWASSGLSVTTPHKEAAAAACDRLSDDAAVLGAVNCVVPRRRQLVGHNTDGPGFVAALARRRGRCRRDCPCVVLGAGGAARAVALSLARAGRRRGRGGEPHRRSGPSRPSPLLGAVGRVVDPVAGRGRRRRRRPGRERHSVGMGEPRARRPAGRSRAAARRPGRRRHRLPAPRDPVPAARPAPGAPPR